MTTETKAAKRHLTDPITRSFNHLHQMKALPHIASPDAS